MFQTGVPTQLCFLQNSCTMKVVHVCKLFSRGRQGENILYTGVAGFQWRWRRICVHAPWMAWES